MSMLKLLVVIFAGRRVGFKIAKTRQLDTESGPFAVAQVSCFYVKYWLSPVPITEHASSDKALVVSTGCRNTLTCNHILPGDFQSHWCKRAEDDRSFWQNINSHNKAYIAFCLKLFKEYIFRIFQHWTSLRYFQKDVNLTLINMTLSLCIRY